MAALSALVWVFIILLVNNKGGRSLEGIEPSLRGGSFFQNEAAILHSLDTTTQDHALRLLGVEARNVFSSNWLVEVQRR